jgi:hypothetical protein
MVGTKQLVFIGSGTTVFAFGLPGNSRRYDGRGLSSAAWGDHDEVGRLSNGG